MALPTRTAQQGAEKAATEEAAAENAAADAEKAATAVEAATSTVAVHRWRCSQLRTAWRWLERETKREAQEKAAVAAAVARVAAEAAADKAGVETAAAEKADAAERATAEKIRVSRFLQQRLESALLEKEEQEKTLARRSVGTLPWWAANVRMSELVLVIQDCVTVTDRKIQVLKEKIRGYDAGGDLVSPAPPHLVHRNSSSRGAGTELVCLAPKKEGGKGIVK